MVRKIKAHKGNRSKMIPIRVTSEIADWLLAKGSIADWVTWKAQSEIDYFKEQFKPYEGVIIEASDNGETFDLAWALLLLKQYGMETPVELFDDIDPRFVRWLAGSEAAAEWQKMKDDGYKPLKNWTDEQPCIWWQSK